VRKPVCYNDKVHSFLNAATGKPHSKNDVVNMLNHTKTMRKTITKPLASILYDYYCHINAGRKRQCSFNEAVSEYVKKLG